MTRLLTASLATLFCRRGNVAVSARSAHAEPSDAPEAGGPGWFDSSWDLQSGLDVREGLPDEARLREWTDVFCLRAPAPQAEMAA